MLRLPNARRPGLSLTEVLVTLFVVAIGLISLMTLFPVGAMQMGQALRDDRIRQTANQADGMTRIWWQMEVVERPGMEDAFFTAMDNPGGSLPPRAPTDSGPSYPVFLDPIGWQARSPATQNWMTGATNSLPRRSARPLGNSLQLTARACSLMDDITFNPNGTPDTTSGTASPGSLVREGAYNWCAVIQRPVNSNRYTADLKICVFHTKGLYGGHIPGLNQTGSEAILSGLQLNAATAGTTQIDVQLPASALALRSGSWILDGSNATVANFYRIQSITEIVAGSRTILELDTPLKSNASQIYVIKGLAEVFDRPQLTASGYRRQLP